MAQNEIQRGGLNSILRRTLNIKGDLPPSSVVGAEIVPVLPLEVDRPEWGYLNEERHLLGETNPGAAAGVFACGMLEVPTQTDLLVVVEKITVQLAATNANFRQILLHIAGPATGIGSLITTNLAQDSTVARDMRYVSSKTAAIGFGTTRLWHGQAAVTGGTFLLDINVQQGQFRDFCERTGPLVLLPGWKLMCWDTQTNEIMCVCYSFRERLLQPNEKPTWETGLL